MAKQLVPYLRKRADVIIALTHLGIYEGLNRGSKRLATQVRGIDLIVDGNTDTKLEAPLIIIDPDSTHQTLIVQAWHWGLVLGKIDLWIRDKSIVDFNMELIPINLKRIVKKPDGTAVAWTPTVYNNNWLKYIFQSGITDYRWNVSNQQPGVHCNPLL